MQWKSNFFVSSYSYIEQVVNIIISYTSYTSLLNMFCGRSSFCRFANKAESHIGNGLALRRLFFTFIATCNWSLVFCLKLSPQCAISLNWLHKKILVRSGLLMSSHSYTFQIKMDAYSYRLRRFYSCGFGKISRSGFLKIIKAMAGEMKMWKKLRIFKHIVLLLYI